MGYFYYIYVGLFVPVTFMLSYYIYKLNNRAVYRGFLAWMMDIVAVIAGGMMVVLYNTDFFLFTVGGVMSGMHLAKFWVKCEGRIYKGKC